MEESSENFPEIQSTKENSSWIVLNAQKSGGAADAADHLVVVNNPETANDPEIRFNCCFGACRSIFDNYNELESHLCYDHFAKTVEQPGSSLICGVNGCDMLIADLGFYKRHLIFHCYHAKLQHKGAILFGKDDRSKDAATAAILCKAVSKSKANNIFYSGDCLRCLWKDCTDVFDDVGIFFAHVYYHVEDEPAVPVSNRKLVACCWRNCSSLFVKKSQLHAHSKHHTGEKYVACPFCGVFFSNATKYFDHMIRQAVSDNSRLKCFLCNKVFPTQRLLREHSRRHINTRKCPYCDMTAVGPHNLRLHINDRHSDMKKHECTVCFRSFSRKSDLQRHFSRHSTDVIYDCDECGAVFSWKNALLMHKRSHRPPTYACHLCPQLYTHGNLLSRHLHMRHDLGLPSGHKRFMYKKCADGYHRLQTERYESVEMIEEDIVDAEDNAENFATSAEDIVDTHEI